MIARAFRDRGLAIPRREPDDSGVDDVLVVADLRRSWVAAAGIWAASCALSFHPVSRHDGVLSVLRGYRVRKLAQLVRRAIGVVPTTHNRLGFRVTASWELR